MAKCKECGWEHPSIAGQCPAAKLQGMVNSEKGKAIAKFVTLLTDHLQNSDNIEDGIRGKLYERTRLIYNINRRRYKRL